MPNPIPTRAFGSTGHESSRLIFGAAALMADNRRVNDQALALLLEHGLNHIDVAAGYGKAEQAVGRWMPEHRARFFLATKTHERSYAGAREQIRRSLERLETDRLDLIQLHNLTQDADWQQAFSEDGCVRALAEARDEGLVRFIGVTGHGTRAPSMHLKSLEQFSFDSVMFPYNPLMIAQPDYRRAVEALLEACRGRGVALQTIKAVARRRWAPDAPQSRRCWYEPIEDAEAFDHAVAFVLATPDLFLNTSSDLTMLERTLASATRWQPDSPPPAEEAMRQAMALAGAEPLFVPGLDEVGPAPG